MLLIRICSCQGRLKIVLQIKNLTLKFGNQEVTTLENISFKINSSVCLGLVGESGSGKTLTALSIMQLLPQQAFVSAKSAIYFEEINLLDLPARQVRQLRGNKIAMIFQDAMAALNPVLTIGQQMQEVITPAAGLKLLSEVGIDNPKHYWQAYPHELSGGMRQRVMIALAISANPNILIADEPTTALDAHLQVQILQLLKQLVKERKMGLLFISHDLSIVKHLADEIVVLKKGRMVEYAEAKNFFLQPQSPYSQALLKAILPLESQKETAPSTEILLEVKNLSVIFGKFTAVEDVNFHIIRGETFALVGQSGSGKTTIAKAIMHLIKKAQGKINLFDKDKRSVQLIFQDPFSALDPRMMIADSLAEGLISQKKISSRKEVYQEIDDWLRQVGLPLAAKWRYPHEFSGGERQRLCLVRALVLRPKLLILDEPTSALDVSIQKQMLQLLADLQTELQLSYLLITHDWRVVSFLAHRVAVMHKGKIVESGTVSAVLNHPENPYTQKLLASIKELN